MGRVIGFATLAAALVLGACSGGADAGGATTSNPMSTIASTTQPLASTTALAPAGPVDSSPKVLFVGNSFTSSAGGLRIHFSKLSVSATPPPIVETVEATTGGATLEMHWQRTYTMETIANGGYDIVVLQGDIPETDVDSFQQHARLLVEATRQAGAEPILFMAWPYDRLGWITTDEIAQAHSEIATELDVDVAPVGLAFQRASAERPEMNMYGLDDEHQSVHGAYLSVNVIYLTIFGTEHPVTLAYLPTGITEEEATFLQRIARETMSGYTANQTS